MNLSSSAVVCWAIQRDHITTVLCRIKHSLGAMVSFFCQQPDDWQDPPPKSSWIKLFLFGLVVSNPWAAHALSNWSEPARLPKWEVWAILAGNPDWFMKRRTDPLSWWDYTSKSLAIGRKYHCHHFLAPTENRLPSRPHERAPVIS